MRGREPRIYTHTKATSTQELTVRLTGFRDDESDISGFTVQLLQQLSCNDTAADSWISISDVINIHLSTVYTFRQLQLQTNIAHRVKVEAINGAQLVSVHNSEAVFVDVTPPTAGTNECFTYYSVVNRLL